MSSSIVSMLCLMPGIGCGGSGPSSSILCLPILPQRGCTVGSSFLVAKLWIRLAPNPLPRRKPLRLPENVPQSDSLQVLHSGRLDGNFGAAPHTQRASRAALINRDLEISARSDESNRFTCGAIRECRHQLGDGGVSRANRELTIRRRQRGNILRRKVRHQISEMIDAEHNPLHRVAGGFWLRNCEPHEVRNRLAKSGRLP